jgi:hypothetical protein
MSDILATNFHLPDGILFARFPMLKNQIRNHEHTS